jgi:2-oxoisovalerate ferredoxin oxidoreductase beta subunit
MDPIKSAEYCIEVMERSFPLGCYRDRTSESEPRRPREATATLQELMGNGSGAEPEIDQSFPVVGMKFSGFGGQGVLSLGLVVAEAASRAGRFVSWFPSYGPEQRGGAASCSVVMGGKEIGSPAVDAPDILVAMNQPSLEKFAPTVRPGGTVLYDPSIPVEFEPPAGVRMLPFPAMDVAKSCGVPKAVNTAFLGALSALGLVPIGDEHLLAALADSFSAKPHLVEKNVKVFEEARRVAARGQ